MVTFTGTISTDGNGMQGTYAVSGGCSNGDAGNWTAAKIQSGQCVPSPMGLLSWWRGDANTSDAMGPNPGTAVGGVSYIPGVAGQAFAFDGSTGYVNVPDSSSLESVKTAQSVEMWIDSSTPPAVTEYVYSHRQPILAESFSLFVMPDGTIGVVVGTTNSPTPGGSKFQSLPGAITFGQFQHVVVTANTATSVAKAYVNGNAISMPNVNGPANFSGTFNSTNQLYLGRREDISVGEGVSGAAYFKGSIDEASLYATELDAAQVQVLFHGGSGGKCPAAGAITLSGPSVLDQSFTTSGSGSVSDYINEAVTYVAQTFTASLTGHLASVSIDVLSQPTGSLRQAHFQSTFLF